MTTTGRRVRLDDLPGRPCPAAAALELVGERWSLLVVRELSFGATRFGEVVRGTGAPRDRVHHVGVRAHHGLEPRVEVLDQRGAQLLVVGHVQENTTRPVSVSSKTRRVAGGRLMPVTDSPVRRIVANLPVADPGAMIDLDLPAVGRLS